MAAKQNTFILRCKYSDVAIGKLEYMTVAGHLPYLSHWDNMTAMHPVFSFQEHKLLAFARNEWRRLAKASEDAETSPEEDTLLRVCFLAVLHTFGSIQQEAPALPPLHIVQSQMPRLFALAYWKHFLESKRFAFPTFKINRMNANTKFENIGYYFDACFDIKNDYEKKVEEAVEREKIVAADRALNTLRNSWIVPASNKALWRWVRAYMPPRYQADAQGWMSTLFLGNEKTMLDFDIDETQLMQQIIEGECPPGTGILKAVRDRIEFILKTQREHKEAFTVDYEEFDTEQKFTEAGEIVEVALPEPKIEQFANKVLYLRARAVWYLQQQAIANRKAQAKIESISKTL